jgi:hypothetical protein
MSNINDWKHSTERRYRRLAALEQEKPILPEPIICPAVELAERVATWHREHPRASIHPLAIGIPDEVSE